METYKAWMSPEGKITEVSDHHSAIALTSTTNPEAAVERGWIRLWAQKYSGGNELVAQGKLENLERRKDDMLSWARYPPRFALQVLLPDGRQLSVWGESQDLMEQSVESLVYRTRVVERAIARRPEVRVRQHWRRA